MNGSVLLVSLELCVLMLVFMHTMRTYNPSMRMSFVHMNLVMLVAIVFNLLSANYFVGINLSVITFSRVINILAYNFVIYESYVILFEQNVLKQRLMSAIPMLIIMVLALLTPFFNLLFTVDMNGKIHDNPCYILVYCEVAYYWFQIVYHIHKKQSEEMSKKYVLIFSITCTWIASVILEKKYNISNMMISTTVVFVVLMYIYMYAEYYNVDSITKCLKRRCFYSDGVRHRRHNFSVLSMDLNNLKYINDNFGHSAGDDALKTFANICKKSKSSKFVLYRTGGDEFMMLGLGASYEETVEVVNRIKQELEGTPYTSSYGIAMYRARDDFDEIVEQADRAMYSDKKQFKLTQPSKIVDCQRQLEQMYKA